MNLKATENLSGKETGHTDSRELSRLPSLDGWRALSILLVLGAHSKFTAGFPPHLESLFNLIFDGDLGVRFFFVISGFLITWLMLLEEKHSGRVNRFELSSVEP